MDRPFVSVVIPTYNRPSLLAKSIQSVLNQSFQDFELLIIDDGDKESAEVVTKSFSDPRIRYFKTSGKVGAASSRNVGIWKAKADFVSFLDDDDTYLPAKLATERQRILERGGEFTFIISAHIDSYEHNQSMRKVRVQLAEGVHDVYKNLVDFSLRVVTSILTVRKTELYTLGGFTGRAEDLDLALRLAERGNAYYIAEPLVERFNLAEGHLSEDKKQRVKNRILILERHQKQFQKYPKALASYYMRLGFLCRDVGEIKQARTFFLRSFKERPTLKGLFQFLKSLFSALLKMPISKCRES